MWGKVKKEIDAIKIHNELIKKIAQELIEEQAEMEKKARAREKYYELEKKLKKDFFTPDNIIENGGFYD